MHNVHLNNLAVSILPPKCDCNGLAEAPIVPEAGRNEVKTKDKP